MAIRASSRCGPCGRFAGEQAGEGNDTSQGTPGQRAWDGGKTQRFGFCKI